MMIPNGIDKETANEKLPKGTTWIVASLYYKRTITMLCQGLSSYFSGRFQLRLVAT